MAEPDTLCTAAPVNERDAYVVLIVSDAQTTRRLRFDDPAAAIAAKRDAEANGFTTKLRPVTVMKARA